VCVVWGGGRRGVEGCEHMACPGFLHCSVLWINKCALWFTLVAASAT